MSSRLAARVRAANRAGEYGAALYPQLRALFEPLVGQKVFKADGGLLAKHEKQLPSLPSGGQFRVYRSASNYSLAWVVSVCEDVDDEYSCVYQEVTVYVGWLRDGVLTELCDRPNFRTDYTAEEVREKRRVYEDAKGLMAAAEAALYPFGENDF